LGNAHSISPRVSIPLTGLARGLATTDNPETTGTIDKITGP
jgi:hypothetical protein